MKKFLIVALVAIILITFSACSIKDVTRYAYAGDDAFQKTEFNFFMAQAMTSAQQIAQKSGDSLITAKDWKTVKIGDMTAEEYVKDNASKSMKQYIILMAKAKALDEEFTAEDEASLSEQRQSIIENYGGRYSYEQYFTELGFTVNAVQNVIRAGIYAQKAGAYFQAPSTLELNDNDEADKPNFYEQIKVTDEDVDTKYKEDYIMTKHIVIMTNASEEPIDIEDVDTSGEAEYTDETDEQKDLPAPKTQEELDADAKNTAKDVLNQLKDGAVFDTLMKQYSQDLDSEGNLNSPAGYVFKKGDMVPEFEEAAYSLKEGEFTQELVKTDYGYHIIIRLVLPTSGEEYDATIEKVESNLQTDKMDNLINKWADELGFSLNEKAIKKAKLHIPQQG